MNTFHDLVVDGRKLLAYYFGLKNERSGCIVTVAHSIKSVTVTLQIAVAECQNSEQSNVTGKTTTKQLTFCIIAVLFSIDI